MASRKEERKDETAGHQRESREIVSRTLDEAKDNTTRAMEEARRDISGRTATFIDYLEQTINAASDIAENYLESQKEIINSIQYSWVPYFENAYSMYWISPRKMTELYARMARSFSDTAIATCKVANNVMFANMEAAKASMQYTRENMKEINRVSVNAARSFEETSRNYQEAMREERQERREY